MRPDCRRNTGTSPRQQRRRRDSPKAIERKEEPFPAGRQRVSPLVNSPKNNTPAVLEPVRCARIRISPRDDGQIDGLRHRADVNVNDLTNYHHHTGTSSQSRWFDCTNKDGQRDQIFLIYVPYLEGRVAETGKGKAYIRALKQHRGLCHRHINLHPPPSKSNRSEAVSRNAALHESRETLSRLPLRAANCLFTNLKAFALPQARRETWFLLMEIAITLFVLLELFISFHNSDLKPWLKSLFFPLHPK